MRSWVIVVFVAGAGCATETTGADATGLVARVDVGAACGHPLGPNGEIGFVATAAGVQNVYTPVAITNTGGTAIYVAENVTWTFEGPDAAELELGDMETTDPSGIGACYFHYPNGGSPLQPGQSCLLGLRFRPTSAGAKQATLRASGGGLDQTFPIVATAVAAPASVYASTPELYVTPMTPSRSLAFDITNPSAASVALGSPVPSPGFSWVWNCPATLAAGAHCTVDQIAFNAGTPGIHGCPHGAFTTTTGALAVPLSAAALP